MIYIITHFYLNLKVFSGSYPKVLSDSGKALLLISKMENLDLNEHESDNENESSKKRKKIEIVIDLKEKM